MFKKILKLSLFTSVLLLNIGCKHGHSHSHDQGASDTTSVETDRQTKEYGSAYICPMHCKGSGSDQPGKCPVCNMDYVVNENAGKDHDHSHDHDEHDHEGHDHN